MHEISWKKYLYEIVHNILQMQKPYKNVPTHWYGNRANTHMHMYIQSAHSHKNMYMFNTVIKHVGRSSIFGEEASGVLAWWEQPSV